MTKTGLRHDGTTRGAFTLVEMLITIGVIAVLAALTISASVVLVQRSEIRQTENVLKLLDVALQEWQTQADRSLTFGQPNVPAGATYEVGELTGHVFTTTEMLKTIGRSSAVKPVLAQIDSAMTHVYDSTDPVIPSWIRRVDPNDPDPSVPPAPDPTPWDGQLAILDAWGVPIRAVHPGAVLAQGTGMPDLDGTARWANEAIYGVPTNRRIGFVSAGPDGKFGDRSSSNTTVRDQAKDNIYSYPLEDR